MAEKITVGNQDINARFLIAYRGGLREMILYLTRVGKSFPIDCQSQRIEEAKANLTGMIPDRVVLRVSSILDKKKRQKIVFAIYRKLRLLSKCGLNPLIFG